jgi:hypothetical protein
MAPPGCPDLAFSTIEAASTLIVSAARFTVLVFIVAIG